MSIVDRLLLTFIVWGALVLLTMPARAQDQTLNIPMSKQERTVILQMCERAVWAARAEFDGACVYFKKKFDDAEALAQPKPPVKPK